MSSSVRAALPIQNKISQSSGTPSRIEKTVTFQAPKNPAYNSYAGNPIARALGAAGSTDRIE